MTTAAAAVVVVVVVVFAGGDDGSLSYPITDPERALGVPKFEAPRISRQSEQGGKAVSPTHQPLLPPTETPGTHFC